MEQAQAGAPARPGRGWKKGGLALLVLALLLCGAALAWKWLAPQPQSQYELDANALAGFLPGKTEEEIQAELNRIIEKGYFNVSINPTPNVAPDGTVNLNIENVPGNNYWMQVNVYIIGEDGGETLLYASGIIKQGYYINEAEAAGKLPAPGQYNGRADFTALMPDTQENIGQTAATMLINVLGEE